MRSTTLKNARYSIIWTDARHAELRYQNSAGATEIVFSGTKARCIAEAVRRGVR